MEATEGRVPRDDYHLHDLANGSFGCNHPGSSPSCRSSSPQCNRTLLTSFPQTLAESLNGSACDAFWAGTSYLLASAVGQPLIASLSDLFGRQQLLLISLIFFSLGAALCAFSHDFVLFLAGRSVQGIGGGGIITMGQIIFSDIVPLRQRPKYFAIVLGAWAIGTILGPVIGGLFVQYLNWHWVFYLNLPFCLAGFVMIPLFVKLNAVSTSTFTFRIRRIDWIGSVLFIGSTTSFLVGISWAGVQFSWLSYQTLTPIIVGVVGILTMTFWENICAEPIIRLALFNNISAIAAYYCAFAQGFILFEALYYTPFYFQSIHHSTALRSGIDIFPVVCLLLPGSIVVSILTTKLGSFRWAIWCGWILTTLGCGLLMLLDEDTKTPVWAGIMAVFGVGNGMVLTSISVGIQAISRTEDCARAASMYAFVRTLGMSVGVAVGSTTFQNMMSSKLSDLGISTAIAKVSEAYISTLYELAPPDPLRAGVLGAYVHGFKAIYLVITCVAGSALIASCFIGKHSMDRELESEFVLGEIVVDVRKDETPSSQGQGKRVPVAVESDENVLAEAFMCRKKVVIERVYRTGW